MSLNLSSKDSSSEEFDNEFLDELASKIDPFNKDALVLFQKLQNHPNSSKLLQSMVLLLLNTKKTSVPNNKTASYLRSHVELLEAITHNTELASLFLVGENGKQTFSSIHKMIIKEQAARTRKYLAENKLENTEKSHLADYRNFIDEIDDLPDKLNELDEEVNKSLKTNNIQQLRQSYQEISSLFSGCMVFNDVLIKNKNCEKKECDDKDDELQRLQEENEKLAVALNKSLKKLSMKKKEIKTMKQQLKENSSLVQNQKKELTDKISILQVRVNELAFHSSSEASEEESEAKSYNENVSRLEEEKDALNAKIEKLQSVIKGKDEKIDDLKDKINEIRKCNKENALKNHKEMSTLQKLYQSSTDSLYEANMKNEELKAQIADLTEQLKSS